MSWCPKHVNSKYDPECSGCQNASPQQRSSFAAPTGLAAVKRESAFYRTTLEQICEDTRNTRAKRLARSALTFWDACKEEAAKRRKAKAANSVLGDPPAKPKSTNP